MTSDDGMAVEPMPKDVLEILMNMGMDEAQAELTGFLGQKIRSFVLDNIGDGEMVSPADLAIAGIACQMTGAWFRGIADEAAAEQLDSQT
jgi:hypothetical protein